jgi:hypothetical protein
MDSMEEEFPCWWKDCCELAGLGAEEPKERRSLLIASDLALGARGGGLGGEGGGWWCGLLEKI